MPDLSPQSKEGVKLGKTLAMCVYFEVTAIHIEVAWHLDTDGFFNAFARFTSR